MDKYYKRERETIYAEQFDPDVNEFPKDVYKSNEGYHVEGYNDRRPVVGGEWLIRQREDDHVYRVLSPEEFEELYEPAPVENDAEDDLEPFFEDIVAGIAKATPRELGDAGVLTRVTITLPWGLAVKGGWYRLSERGYKLLKMDLRNDAGNDWVIFRDEDGRYFQFSDSLFKQCLVTIETKD